MIETVMDSAVSELEPVKTGIELLTLVIMFCIVDSLVDCIVLCFCSSRFFMCSNDLVILLHMLSSLIRYLARAIDCDFAIGLVGMLTVFSSVVSRGPQRVPSGSTLCLGSGEFVECATGVFGLCSAVAGSWLSL